MIVVMGVMAASSLFVAAAFAAANGDLPLTRDSQDRKQSYAAAEAGINLYQYHLNQDPDYWNRCTNVPAPNATENQPVNQAWNGTTPTTDPRRWRNVAGRNTQYTLELLPAPGKTTCVEGDLASMVDPDDRHVPHPLDGPPARGQQAQAQRHRQLPAQVLPRLPLLHRLRDDRPDQLHRHATSPGRTPTAAADATARSAPPAVGRTTMVASRSSSPTPTRSRARSTRTTAS